MSARNYFSGREKNFTKTIDYLPNINNQRFNYRSGQEFPSFSATTSNYVNRNINYYEVPYINNCERSSTPFSDFFSESDSGTPDFHSEESDSSVGSALLRSTAVATRSLADEWNKIERTLYDEDGEKTGHAQIIEECKQWKQIHPQLRVTGKSLPLPDKKLSCIRQIDHDEIIAIHYSDYEQFSESEERLSQSSTDITPQNSPRTSAEDIFEPKLNSYHREKLSHYPVNDCNEFSEDFCSLLQITPIQIRSPSSKKNYAPTSIVKSDMASMKWMRNHRPDSSINERNSAKSFVSLDMRKFSNYTINGMEQQKVLNSRISTARSRDVAKLQPLYTPESNINEYRQSNGIMANNFNVRKVSLPPLLLEEEKRKYNIGSAKKHSIRNRRSSKTYNLDRMKH